MTIPLLDFAKASVRYYCAHIFDEYQDDFLAHSVRMFDLGYEQCQREARGIFRHALQETWDDS